VGGILRRSVIFFLDDPKPCAKAEDEKHTAANKAAAAQRNICDRTRCAKRGMIYIRSQPVATWRVERDRKVSELQQE
jgi:hypothetical protein